MLWGSGGITNPIVLVEFNPQPAPAAARLAVLNLAHPPEPGLVLSDQHNPEGGGLALFEVFLAIGLPGVQLTFGGGPAPVEGTPSTLHARAGGPTGDSFFDVFLDISSSSGGVLAPGSLVGFNPQPEPPAFGADSDFGISFSITSLSDAIVGLRVYDAEGHQISFSVPEPSSLALIGLGLAVLAWRRSRRCHRRLNRSVGPHDQEGRARAVRRRRSRGRPEEPEG